VEELKNYRYATHYLAATNTDAEVNRVTREVNRVTREVNRVTREVNRVTRKIKPCDTQGLGVVAIFSSFQGIIELTELFL
jgi:hypothetical protein